MFGWYNVSGALAGAMGALGSGVPGVAARHYGWSTGGAERSAFVAYAAIALVTAWSYRSLSPAVEHAPSASGGPLARSRAVVLELSALFSLDSFGGGFVVQSLLVLWLVRRFQLSAETAAVVFFAAGVVGAFSQ